MARQTKAQLESEVESLKRQLDKRYNGWTNYETWAVALWIDNDEGSSCQRNEMARDAWENNEERSCFTKSESARLAYADALKDWIEEMNPLNDSCSLFSDMLTSALSEVDWQSIADNWLSEECGDEGYKEWRTE